MSKPVIFTVSAIWDEEAKVGSGHCDDIPAAADAASQKRPAWAVQLGSFASRSNAEKLVHRLQGSAGSSVYVISSGSGSSLRFRVRMGPLADRGAAELLRVQVSGAARL